VKYLIGFNDIEIIKTQDGCSITGTMNIKTGNHTSHCCNYYKVTLVHKESELETRYYTSDTDKEEHIRCIKAFIELNELAEKYYNGEIIKEDQRKILDTYIFA
jgi:hypothetical protein